MEKLITGLHHVTAISGDAQESIDFYTGILGLRLVKKTVNFEDPHTYHFYFGNETGNAGTIMTTFPYGKNLPKGRHGKGKINTTAFSLPLKSLDYWQGRLEKYAVAFKQPQQRLNGEVFIYLEDYDGLGLELVFSEKENRPGYTFKENLPIAHSIRGLHHVELWVEAFERTGALLTTVLNHQLIEEGASRFRYAIEDRPGQYIDLLCAPNSLKGLQGRGMVHHVAFATPDAQTQLTLMQAIETFGLQTTEVKDRKYFKSIYFNEPSGIIFEIATSGPGFTLDEDLSTLGRTLQLPEQYEEKRAELHRHLPHFNYPTPTF